MTKQEIMVDFVTQTIARIAWCIIIAGFIWLVAWITNPHIDSGSIWIIGFSVGLITYQIAPRGDGKK